MKEEETIKRRKHKEMRRKVYCYDKKKSHKRKEKKSNREMVLRRMKLYFVFLMKSPKNQE